MPITILETGSALLAADGEWNDPIYAATHGSRAYFVGVPREVSEKINLRAMEYDVFTDDELPTGFVSEVRNHYERINRQECPWLY